MHKKTDWIHKTLHFLEWLIAIITLVVLVGMLALEIYRMFTVADYFDSINTYLHNILTLVVGLEFVRMLLDMTPANTLEVLIVAIARQVILSHDNPWSNVASVVWEPVSGHPLWLARDRRRGCRGAVDRPAEGDHQIRRRDHPAHRSPASGYAA